MAAPLNMVLGDYMLFELQQHDDPSAALEAFINGEHLPATSEGIVHDLDIAAADASRLYPPIYSSPQEVSGLQYAQPHAILRSNASEARNWTVEPTALHHSIDQFATAKHEEVVLLPST